MSSSGNIITRIIDIDSQAETIRAQARDEAAVIHRDAERLIEQEKRDLEQRTLDKTEQVRAEAARERKVELDRVRKEFSTTAESIKHLPKEKIEKSVQSILSLIKEAHHEH